MQNNEIDIKKRILITAKEQFMKYGFSMVRMEDLANEMGMSKKTIYNHYRSKDELIRECISYIGNETRCWIEEIFANQNLSFVSKLKQFIILIGKINTLMSPLVLEDLRRNVPTVWRIIEEVRTEHLTQGFKKILIQGIQEGVFKDEFNLDVLVMMYYHAINSIISPENLVKVNYSPNEAFQTIFKVILQGIMTDQARQEMQSDRTDPSNNLAISTEFLCLDKAK
ncbi:MAG: TetR/AcrR family transcriptional regulator [Microscillaceae bacterium]|nr:TetR/AcrR family transcriptional regulator [Microscillaceae bacterium]MDW8460304.1 TetR/AcrR family transcriptional regulator [Cytophagales bacterium]